MDAIIAVSLVDLSMQDCTLDDTTDALHSTIPKYSDYDYLCTAKKLLTQLRLLDIWQNELLYYAKLLQVDHKTLENDIEKGNCKLFAKYDDVTDDNIQLSASLITSSYFNNKKPNNDDDDTNFVRENNEKKGKKFQNGIDEKFAATLKKHATLNKAEREPPIQRKKGNKRKRKEVTVDSSSIRNKLPKKGKKSKGKVPDDEISNSDEDFDESTIMLNAVPSVNDVFADLGIDFKFDSNTSEDVVNKEIKSKPEYKDNYESMQKNDNKNSGTESDENDVKESKNRSVHEKSTKTSETESDKNVARESKNNAEVKQNTVNKLLQFQFAGKHDFDKYDEKPSKMLNKSAENIKTDLDKSKENISTSVYKKPSKSQISIFETSTSSKPIDLELDDAVPLNKSVLKENSSKSSNHKVSNPSSQISMFESSDCDIDLDI